MDKSGCNSAVIKDEVFIFAYLRLCLDAAFSFCKQNGQNGRAMTEIAEAVLWACFHFRFSEKNNQGRFWKNREEIEPSSFVLVVFSFRFNGISRLDVRLSLICNIANMERSRSFTIDVHVQPLNLSCLLF